MKPLVLLPLVLLICLTGCRSEMQVDHQSEWRDVLQHKAAAMTAGAALEQKQRYADALRGFVERHPTHERGREVWRDLQLEFAESLTEGGRYRDAIRIYQAILTHEPENEPARAGLAVAVERIAITRDKLLELKKGMNEPEVAALLGRPIPGWTATKRRPETTIDAWYYQTRDGGVAAVYFRDGKVFAAEEDSSAMVGRLGS